MNIFYLDKSPSHAAYYACDKHVVKMVLETAQMLCSAYPKGKAPYRRTHYNHPCTVWSRQNRANYEWLGLHGLGLAFEYGERYGRRHKSEDVIEWCILNAHTLNLPDGDFTDPPQCMPDDVKVPGDTVTAYRQLYMTHKRNIAKWAHSPTPHWFK